MAFPTQMLQEQEILYSELCELFKDELGLYIYIKLTVTHSIIISQIHTDLAYNLYNYYNYVNNTNMRINIIERQNKVDLLEDTRSLQIS